MGWLKDYHELGSVLQRKKKKLFCNLFIMLAFNYCPLIWLFSSKK